MTITLPCRECRTDIVADTPRKKYCDECAVKVCAIRKKEWKRRQRNAVRIIGKCKFCSKEFVHRVNRTVFCGRKCRINSGKAAGYRKKINMYKKKITELRRERK